MNDVFSLIFWKLKYEKLRESGFIYTGFNSEKEYILFLENNEIL